MTLAQSQQVAAGRGYWVADLPVLMALGVSAGMASVLVLALYINDPETRRLYPGTVWLWLVPTLMLYWVSRVWMKTHRDETRRRPRGLGGARLVRASLTVTCCSGSASSRPRAA